MKLPFVSIIIVTYNAEHFIKDCLDSILKINYPRNKFEVIIVDNASTDGTLTSIKNRYTWVKIITLDKNYGFAEGNNRGIKYAKGEYVVFLNQDTKVDKNWLIELAKVAKNKNVGICGSLLKDFHNPQIIQIAENYLDFFGNIFHKGQGEKDIGQFKLPIETFFVSGASILIKKVVLNKLKYCFDPAFFMYFEDIDLCWRVRLLDYNVIFVPLSVVYHKGNINMLDVKPINVVRYTTNKIKTFRKLLRFPLKQLFIIFVLLRTFISVLFWYVKGKWNYGTMFLDALFEPINHDVNINKVSLKKQLSIFSFPNIRSYAKFFKYL